MAAFGEVTMPSCLNREQRGRKAAVACVIGQTGGVAARGTMRLLGILTALSTQDSPSFRVRCVRVIPNFEGRNENEGG